MKEKAEEQFLRLMRDLANLALDTYAAIHGYDKTMFRLHMERETQIAGAKPLVQCMANIDRVLHSIKKEAEDVHTRIIQSKTHKLWVI